MIKVDGKLQPNPGRISSSLGPPPSKEPQPAEMLAEDSGITELGAEEGSGNTSCEFMNSYRNKDLSWPQILL